MAVRPQSELPRDQVHAGHQPDETNAWGILIGIFVLLACLGLVVWLMLLLIEAFAGPPQETVKAPRQVRDPSVVHWSGPWTDRERLEALEHERMNAVEWIDRERGIARIPLNEALEAAGRFTSWEELEDVLRSSGNASAEHNDENQ